MGALAEIDPGSVEVLLCDADGTLFPSEEPAFDASVEVTNRFLEEVGAERRFTAEQLRLATTGKNFRATAAALAADGGAELDPGALERWVAQEKRCVTAHLAGVLRPDPGVGTVLRRLAARLGLAVVTSSAASRVDACLHATGLRGLFPEEVRFSAEDSLDTPVSKPSPAVYLHAGRQLGISGEQGLAVEDAAPGVQSAVAAGFPVVGNVMFVPREERRDRSSELIEAGALAVVTSWSALETLLPPSPSASAPLTRVAGI